MQTIDAELDTGQISRFHLIYGEERFMVRHYRNALVKALRMEEDEMNCSRYEGDDVNLSEIMDVGQTLPFFAEKRLIVIQDSGLFKSSNDMADMLPAMSEVTYVVFVEKEVDKRNRLYKYVQKNGCVTEAKEESQPRLMNWVAGYLKKAGRSISKNIVQTFLMKVGNSMEVLMNEMEKLIAYTDGRDTIELEDIDAVCTAQITGKIFDMVDAVSSQNTKRALELYHDLLELKEPPMRILFLFTRQVNIMLQVIELQKKGNARDDIAKKCGIPPFAVNKYQNQGKNFGREGLIRMLNHCVELEESVKTGRLTDQLAVELFIMGN